MEYFGYILGLFVIAVMVVGFRSMVAGMKLMVNEMRSMVDVMNSVDRRLEGLESGVAELLGRSRSTTISDISLRTDASKATATSQPVNDPDPEECELQAVNLGMRVQPSPDSKLVAANYHLTVLAVAALLRQRQ